MKLSRYVFTLLLFLTQHETLNAQIYNPDGSIASGSAYIGIWRCSLDNIGATLTECLPAQGGTTKAYITWITIQSTTTVSGLFLLRTGTGTNCSTGTTSIYPSDATVSRFAYPASTSTPLHVTFLQGVPMTAANSQLCIICTAVNTCTVAMGGPLAP